MNPILERFDQRDTKSAVSLSVLLHLGVLRENGGNTEYAMDLTGEKTLVIPDNMRRLVRLIAQGSEAHRSFLSSLAEKQLPQRFFQTRLRDPRALRRPNEFYEEFRFSPDVFAKRIYYYQERNTLEWAFPDEGSEIFRDLLEDAFDISAYEISLSPRRNFVREYYSEILAWSNRTFSPLLSKNIHIFDSLGKYLPALQIPPELITHAILVGPRAKQDFVSNLLTFHPYLPAAKLYLGIAVLAASKLEFIPEKIRATADVFGAVLVFTDP